MLDMTRYIKLAHGDKWKDKTGDYNKKFLNNKLIINLFAKKV